MGNRLSQIATRTGDDGTTGLGDGTRVDKDHLRVAAMGDVDELNSTLGVLLTHEVPVEETVAITNRPRLFLKDPFGNRIELTQIQGAYA